MKTSKRAVALLLAALLVLGAVQFSTAPVYAAEVASGTCGDSLTWTLEDDGTLTISGTGEMTDFSGTEYYTETPWYTYRNDIRSIVIQSGVASIGDGAFGDIYPYLTNVTIPNTVTQIGSNAFSFCLSLTSINIPDGVTEIEWGAFHGCGITSVTIPDSVVYIGPGAFAACESLTSFTVSSGNTAYSAVDGVMFGDSGRTLTVYPAGKANTTYTIPNSVTKVGQSSFDGCKKLTSITIPDTVREIEGLTFQNCTGLTGIVIPNGVTYIGFVTFSGCTELSTITIPDSVTWIEASAFENCISLTDVTIPDSVTNIHQDAFKNCTSLTDIIIPDSVSYIDGRAFEGCTSLTSATLPDSITTIEYGVFGGCTSLAQVTVPDSVTSIGSWAFGNCSAMTATEIGSGVNSIGLAAYDGCVNLQQVYYHGTLTDWNAIEIAERNEPLLRTGRYYMGDGGNTSPTNYTWAIMDDVLTITPNANFSGIPITNYSSTVHAPWYGNRNTIGHIVIKPGITAIGTYAFSGVTSLKTVTIPDTVTAIGEYAFADCDAVQAMIIPAGVIEIADTAFDGDNDLTLYVYENSYAHQYAQTNSIPFQVIPVTAIPYGVLYVPKSVEFADDLAAVATGTDYVDYTFGGTIPDGMTLDHEEGILSGVPLETGNFTFAVMVQGYETVGVCGYSLEIKSNTDDEIEDVVDEGYEILDYLGGDDRVVDLAVSDEEDYMFRSNGEFSEFVAVYIDGQELERGVEYIAEEGSTKITIRTQTMKKQTTGKHTIAAEFKQPSSNKTKVAAQNYQVKDTSSRSTSNTSTYVAPKYTVTLRQNTGGTITSSTTSTTAGSVVTLTVTVDKGYKLVKVSAGDSSITDAGNNKYTFTMPKQNVSVEATFEEDTGLPFTDVKKNQWFFDSVRYVYENGLMLGTGNNLFQPNLAASRGMIVTILYRIEGEPAVTIKDMPFDDVLGGKWYSNAVIWATENGIVTGDDEGLFRPDSEITREELASILFRYATYKNAAAMDSTVDLSAYEDAEEIGSYAYDAMMWVNKAGIITGTTNLTLAPKAGATRAEVATVLQRFCGLAIGSADD